MANATESGQTIAIIDTIQCDACSHRWDAVGNGVSIGPSDEVGIVLSCNRCWFHYLLPSTVERYRWQKWLDAFRESDEVRGSEINAFVSAIDEEFQDRPHYPRLPFPTIVARCHECGKEMSKQIEPAYCPKCGQFAGKIVESFLASVVRNWK